MIRIECSVEVFQEQLEEEWMENLFTLLHKERHVHLRSEIIRGESLGSLEGMT